MRIFWPHSTTRPLSLTLLLGALAAGCGGGRDPVLGAGMVGARGFGQSRPNAYATSAEGRQENRRVSTILNYPEWRSLRINASDGANTI